MAPPLSFEVFVVDYEMGNLRSVARALEKAEASVRVSSDPQALAQADAVVLPGVGAADAAMRALHFRGLVGPMREYVAAGRPFLGVCLGMQLLLQATEEGEAPCLGIVPGKVRRLPPGQKVPHMGWNWVDFRQQHPAFDGLGSGGYFYFVHSYYPDPEDGECVAGVTDYGVTFCSAVGRGNLTATQFHPEKSGPTGLKIYRNFVSSAVEWASRSSSQPGSRSER